MTQKFETAEASWRRALRFACQVRAPVWQGPGVGERGWRQDVPAGCVLRRGNHRHLGKPALPEGRWRGARGTSPRNPLHLNSIDGRANYLQHSKIHQDLPKTT